MFLCFSCLCCFSPFRFVLRLFPHELEGADPSSYEAYPQAIAPALRPSEGQGRGIVLGRLDTAFRDPFFALMCLAEGHRDPSGLFIWGGGAFSAPSGPFSHALVPAPGFFFSCWPSGPRMDCQTPLWRDYGRIAFTACATGRSMLVHPPPSCEFLLDLGGNAVRFFPALCFGKSP